MNFLVSAWKSDPYPRPKPTAGLIAYRFTAGWPGWREDEPVPVVGRMQTRVWGIIEADGEQAAVKVFREAWDDTAAIESIDIRSPDRDWSSNFRPAPKKEGA